MLDFFFKVVEITQPKTLFRGRGFEPVTPGQNLECAHVPFTQRQAVACCLSYWGDKFAEHKNTFSSSFIRTVVAWDCNWAMPNCWARRQKLQNFAFCDFENWSLTTSTKAQVSYTLLKVKISSWDSQAKSFNMWRMGHSTESLVGAQTGCVRNTFAACVLDSGRKILKDRAWLQVSSASGRGNLGECRNTSWTWFFELDSPRDFYMRHPQKLLFTKS